MSTQTPLIDQLDTLVDADPNVILKSLNQRAMLLDVTVHQWEGRHQIGDSKVTVGKDSLELPSDLVSKSHWVLRPQVWGEKFNQLAGLIRNTVSPKIQARRGLDVVALKEAPRILKTIRALQHDQFEPAVKEFLAAWPSIIAELQPNLVKHFKGDEAKANAVYKQLAIHLPTTEKLASKFGVEVEVLPLGDNLTSLKEGLKGTDAEAFVKEIEGYTKQFALEVVYKLTEEPLKELQAVVDGFRERVAAGKGGLRAESVDVIRKSLEKVKAFGSFVAKPELLTAIKAVDLKLSEYSHEDLNLSIRNKTIVAAGLAEMMQGLSEQAQAGQSAVHKFGRKFRKIDINGGSDAP